jgi:hypothetical protein
MFRGVEAAAKQMLYACDTLLLMQQRRPRNNAKKSEMFVFPLPASLILRLGFKSRWSL